MSWVKYERDIRIEVAEIDKKWITVVIDGKTYRLRVGDTVNLHVRFESS